MKNTLAPALGVLLALATSCSTLSSGRAYTLSRVDRDLTLVPSNTQIVDSEKDRIGELPKSYLQIVLNSGYLRYLEAIVRPEVAVFARVYVRDLKKPDETLVWEKVFLESEKQDLQLVTNKDSFLPRINIPILPGIVYDEQEIYVSLRIIELDSDDNGRIKEVVNAAATTTAAFQPEAAVAASAVQTVLSFLTALNSDDIEFQFDFALIPNGGSMEVSPCAMLPRAGAKDGESQLLDVVLEPRLGTYTVIKTEHRTRANYPSDYFDFAHNTLRWTAASIIKLGTLGVLNWRMWETLGATRNEDYYMRLFGRPFVIDYEAWQMPEYVAGKLSLPEIGGRLYMTDNRLHYRRGSLNRTFADQSYLTLTLLEPPGGVDLGTLTKANNAKKSINAILNTGQLSPEAAGELAKKGAEALVGAVQGEEIREKLDKDLASATTPAEVEAAMERAKKLVDNLRVSSDVKDQVRDRLKARAERAHIGVDGSGNLDAPSLRDTLVLESADDTSNTTLLVIKHRPGGSVQLLNKGYELVESPTGDPTRTAVRASLTTRDDGDYAPVEYEIAFKVGGSAYAFPFWSVPQKIKPATLELWNGQKFEAKTADQHVIPAKGKLRIGKLTAGATSVWSKITSVKAGTHELKFSIDSDGRLTIESPNVEVKIEEIVTAPLQLEFKQAAQQ